MTNENVNVTGEVAVEEKPKRKRAPRTTVQKTGAEIVAEITALENEVAGLEAEIDNLEVGGVIHDLAKEALEAKREELNKAFTQVYKA